MSGYRSIPIFPRLVAENEVNGELTNTGVGFDTAATITATVGAGTYFIEAYCEVRADDATNLCNVRLEQVSLENHASIFWNPSGDNASTSYGPCYFKRRITLAAGSFTFNLGFASNTASQTVRARRNRVWMSRVSV